MGLDYNFSFSLFSSSFIFRFTYVCICVLYVCPRSEGMGSSGMGVWMVARHQVVLGIKPRRSLLSSHGDRAFPEESSHTFNSLFSPEAELRRALLPGQLQPIMFGTFPLPPNIPRLLTLLQGGIPHSLEGWEPLSRSTLDYLENIVNAGSLKQTGFLKCVVATD